MSDRTHRRARYASVAAAAGVALASGTNYAYSAWAPDFGRRLHLSATESNIIGVAGNMGMYATGIVSGILIDKKGPKWGVALGAVAQAAGYFPIYQAYNAGPGSMSVGAISFCSFLTGFGGCCANSAALKTCTYNWPDHRGTATAFPLSAFGLSAFVFTAVASFAFGEDISGYLLLLSVGTLCLHVLSFFFIRLIPTNPSYSSLPQDDSGNRSDSVRSASSELRRSKSSERARQQEDTDENSPLTSSASHHKDSKPGHVEITGFAILKEVSFWQLFVILGMLSGVGLMTINNIGNDARALWHAFDPNASSSYIHQRQQLHVSILSLASFVGRLLSGVGSDILVKRLRASRYWCLEASAFLFCTAQLCALLISRPKLLVLVSSLTGLGYGALFGCFPALVADAFGAQGLALNWGIIIFAPVISGNIYNLAYGRIFDAHSRPSEPDGRVDCTEGLACYRDAYWVTLASSIAGVILALWCVRYEQLRKRRDMEKIKRRSVA